MSKLGELCTILSGFAFDSNLFTKDINHTPLIRIRDIKNGKTDTYYSGIYDEKYVIQKNDFLIGMDGEFNIGQWKDKKALLNQRVCKIVCNEKLLVPKYAYYFLHKALKKIEDRTSFVTVKHLSVKEINNIEIPLPPIETQQKIANILDKASELIEKRKAQIEKLDLLVKAKFIDMFGDPVNNPKGWNKKVLSDLGLVGSSKRVFISEILSEGIPFYRGTEISQLSLGLNIKPTMFISQEHYDLLKKTNGIPKVGDLLLPSICSEGQIWLVNNKDPFYFKDGRVLWIKVDNDSVNSTYLKYILKNIFRSQYSNIASGTTFAELKIFVLKSLEILVPHLELQQSFADFVTSVETQKSLLQKGLEKLELNYKSLMQNCFNGTLFK